MSIDEPELGAIKARARTCGDDAVTEDVFLLIAVLEGAKEVRREAHNRLETAMEHIKPGTEAMAWVHSAMMWLEKE